MKFIKQDLLTLLIGLFLFASCKNPTSVGLDVDPNSAIQGTLVSDQPVSSQTVQEPDVNTANLLRYPLGYMTDPVFGKTEASVAMTVYPSELSIDFGTSSILDSAVLVLDLGTQFYGDTTSSRYSIDVYQLANTITKYKSSDVQAHNTALLGNFNSKIYPNTPIKVTEIVTGAKDTLRTLPAQLRIPLNKAFIQSSILSLATTSTSSNLKFADIFKGLYAEVNKTSSTGTGGIAFLDFSTTNSYLQLVYRKTNASNGIDTLSKKFPITNSTIGQIVTANIKHDYTGTPVKTQLDNPATQYTVTYLQAVAGLKTKISFPNLKNFTSVYGKALINKAELVVDLSAGSYAYPFNAPQRLSLYRWDIAQQPVNVPDHDQPATNYAGDRRALSDAVFGGYYDALKNRYVFNVTSYVQDLIDSKKLDYGTFIAPTSLNEFEVTPSASSAARAVIGSFGNTTNRLKLNIYYTKIN
ncbi:DUF4270 domain-containing protein [Pedobacter sp. Leaf194]|uniref:DUF4270 domain-containing protein n=1 Tax=Pedobacter sp. Leaf194 TaxID=1736297 RepID=UPI000703C1B6|nr:DUF4270 domain-containing protein [Pedobacter sp. Leaf194]KQS41329.1 hypothetical protein ASG14_02305 [Pedobacter sp. Leaf194]